MRRLALVLLAAVPLAGCGGGSENESATTGSSRGQTVTISEQEFSLMPGTVDIERAGAITFKVRNDGQTTHALEVEGNGVEEETEHIQPGQSATLTVQLGKSGTYEIYCPIDGHEDKGMKATVHVGSSPGGGTSTGGTTTESGPGY